MSETMKIKVLKWIWLAVIIVSLPVSAIQMLATMADGHRVVPLINIEHPKIVKAGEPPTLEQFTKTSGSLRQTYNILVAVSLWQFIFTVFIGILALYTIDNMSKISKNEISANNKF